MPDLKPPRRLHHVEGADDIAVKVCTRVLKAVAHPGLRGEVDDHLWREIIRHLIEQALILQHAFRGRKSRGLQQHRVAALFQRDVIVVRHAVIAMHAEAFGQQEAGKMKTDEPGRAGDQNLASHAANRRFKTPKTMASIARASAGALAST